MPKAAVGGPRAWSNKVGTRSANVNCNGLQTTKETETSTQTARQDDLNICDGLTPGTGEKHDAPVGCKDARGSDLGGLL